MSRWHSANVLKVGLDSRQLWEFSAADGHFTLEETKSIPLAEGLPLQSVGRDWRSLFRHKLNVAWLPPEKVFLRAVQLPGSDLSEILSMVEFQMEKLSPLPVAQIVWSIELLPKKDNNPGTLQTVIVTITARSFVEEFLGELEGQGFLTDRLEVPSLDQLLATKNPEDGVWIYFSASNEPTLIAWWYGGILQNLTLLTLPPGPERETLLKTQIEQMAWAGELDGWLTGPPQVHLVSPPEITATWEPLLNQWSEQLVQVNAPVPMAELAALSAQRSADAGSKANLLPPEFLVRYHQQFIDGLWMRGLFSVLAVYTLGVLIFFGALFVVKFKQTRLLNEADAMGLSYTNALRDEARIQILKDRDDLKYAALNCWKAVAEALPTSVVVEEITFNRGRFDLRGTVPNDSQDQVTTFNDSMRKATVRDESIFSVISPPTMNMRGGQADWKFTCTLRGGEK